MREIGRGVVEIFEVFNIFQRLTSGRVQSGRRGILELRGGGKTTRPTGLRCGKEG